MSERSTITASAAQRAHHFGTGMRVKSGFSGLSDGPKPPPNDRHLVSLISNILKASIRLPADYASQAGGRDSGPLSSRLMPSPAELARPRLAKF
jgi:hypothetical protein